MKKHQETETTLGQQARKLQVYCDEATRLEIYWDKITNFLIVLFRTVTSKFTLISAFALIIPEKRGILLISNSFAH